MIAGELLQGMPASQLESLLNPETFMRATTEIDPAIHSFLKDPPGTAIKHGYFVGIAFAIIGFLSVLNTGPDKAERPKKSGHASFSPRGQSRIQWKE